MGPKFSRVSLSGSSLRHTFESSARLESIEVDNINKTVHVEFKLNISDGANDAGLLPLYESAHRRSKVPNREAILRIQSILCFSSMEEI